MHIPLEPTQLFESVIEFANFLFLVWLLKRKKFEGQVIGSYLFIYGVARFFIEFLRDDPERGIDVRWPMTGTQFISICLVIAGGILWMRRSKSATPQLASVAQR